jgi:hypothetical protein
VIGCPLGINLLIILLIFSLLPLCHEAYGSHLYILKLLAFPVQPKWANSVPLSDVILLINKPFLAIYLFSAQ